MEKYCGKCLLLHFVNFLDFVRTVFKFCEILLDLYWVSKSGLDRKLPPSAHLCCALCGRYGNTKHPSMNCCRATVVCFDAKRLRKPGQLLCHAQLLAELGKPR